MRQRRKLWWIVESLLALLLALGVGVWGFLVYDPRPTLHLRDGSTASLQAVWSDRAPAIVMGPGWMQTLYPLVPAPQRQRWAWTTSYSSLRPGPGLSVMCRGGNSRIQPPRAVLQDQHGCEFYSTAVEGDTFGEHHILIEQRFSPSRPAPKPCASALRIRRPAKASVAIAGR